MKRGGGSKSRRGKNKRGAATKSTPPHVKGRWLEEPEG